MMGFFNDPVNKHSLLRGSKEQFRGIELGYCAMSTIVIRECAGRNAISQTSMMERYLGQLDILES